MAVQLIRPVGAQKAEERRTVGLSLLVLGLATVGTILVTVGDQPRGAASALSLTSSALSPIKSADSAETKVANYMAMMATKELIQKPQPKAHPTLDWNWAPELNRNKQVPGWVGSRWVAPVEGTKGIRLMHRPEHSSGAAQDSISSQFAQSQTTTGNLPNPQMMMPSMHPLRFFPQEGIPTWDTGDVVKSAEKSVSFVHTGGHGQKKLLVSSAPRAPSAQWQGSLTQVTSGSLAQTPYKISPEKAGTAKANLEAKVNNLQRALAQVEGELQVKEAQKH